MPNYPGTEFSGAPLYIDKDELVFWYFVLLHCIGLISDLMEGYFVMFIINDYTNLVVCYNYGLILPARHSVQFNFQPKSRTLQVLVKSTTDLSKHLADLLLKCDLIIFICTIITTLANF